MLDKQKIIGITVIVAVIVIVSAVYVASNSKPKSSTSNSQAQTYDPKNPPFKYGVVTRSEADHILFQAGGQTLTAQIGKNTRLVKQVAEKTGLIDQLPVTTDDFKPTSRIVVYFSTPPQNNVYAADQVQIIGQ